MRSPQRLKVPIHLRRERAEPLQAQLATQLRRAILTGQLAPGARLPSTRTLAGVLGVSRGVALTAYEVLFAEGYITGRHGSGTYVSGPAPARAPAVQPSPPVLIDLRRERPSTQAFPLAAWRAAWRRASHHAPPADEPPAFGLPELRTAIAAYLRESRGLVLDRHEVVVTAGYGDALELLVRAQQGRRRPVVALEEPAPPALRAALARFGTVLPLPADGAGARPDLVPDGCDVVMVLPERGGPLGTRMPVERRRELAAWARDSGGLVVEPAFDGLFDPRANPLPSVLTAGVAVGDAAGDAPGTAGVAGAVGPVGVAGTAMVGSFCEVLTPALRLAFAVVPRHLAGAVEEAGAGQPSFTCQLAVTDLLGSGTVARRAERLSALYAAKRALVRQELGAYPGVRLLGADTGAAVTLLLPARVEAGRVIAALRERQVIVADLADFYQGTQGDGGVENGVVLCYGHLDLVTLRRALHTVVGTLDELRPARRTAA